MIFLLNNEIKTEMTVFFTAGIFDSIIHNIRGANVIKANNDC